MGLHKLTAGDGYTYLTRQVAAHDATDRGHAGLADYYSEKGESPGRWWGAALAGLGMEAGEIVTEVQMKNLFGQGRHPDAERLEQLARESGLPARQTAGAASLGRAFAVYEGAVPFQRTVARRFAEYNAAHGRHWQTPVPSEVRARIRTEAADEMFTTEHGRAPVDDRERAGFLARASRQQTTAVAGYDLTFTPVKSVSTLWALADPQVAARVQAAHDAAVEQTLRYLEREALFTRRGRNGVQQVRARGLVAASFTHRDARSGDPNLHTHVAVSNKVQDATGTWLAVDGRVLFKANVTLSEMYNTLLEAELVARLGVEFAPRTTARSGTSGTSGKRAVREITGIDPRLSEAWSSRSTAIEGRRRELAVDFQAAHGRPPTPVESYALAQQATLETRQAKHAPRSEADQRANWRAEAIRVLGSSDAVEAMLAAAVGGRTPRQRVTRKWVDETAERVVRTVQADRATWQVWHLRAEAHRRIRSAGVARTEVDVVAERIVRRAITRHSIAFADPDPLVRPGAAPAALTRPDGESVYTVHGLQLYTSRAIVDAEHRLVTAATRSRGGSGRRVTDVRIDIALARSASAGVPLNAAQATMVRELATSGAALQLALAPAGTGKTTALRVLASAWRDGGGTVMGLAPSAVAAHELRAAMTAEAESPPGGVCDTLSKFVWCLDPDHRSPTWVDEINQTTLVLIDEAGMASTTELDRAVAFITGRGGSVRLVGDDRQLASVAAGGVLRDIATTAGAVTLTEVVRFTHPDGRRNHAEAAATLAVRDGDAAALGYYADHGRIHVGDLAGAADQAYRAWSADRASGQDSLLLAPTRELVAELNTRARKDRLTRSGTGDQGAAPCSVRLADGTEASAGDVILTRRNDRRLRLGPTDWVKNGDRWTVRKVHPDGSVTAVHHILRRSLRLPGDYVEGGDVQLGYASTIHGAQGTTADTTHTVLTGEEDRALLYVALSRGRGSNHVYLNVGTDGDPHTLIRPETLLPPTALDRLTDILARDGAPVSATTALRGHAGTPTQLADATARYLDAVTFAAEQLLGPGALQRLDAVADSLVVDLSDAPAWPTLRSHLALRALDGHDPGNLLRRALALGGLGDAADPAAVLDSRLEPGLRTGPLPWLPAIPHALAADPDWGAYLTHRHRRVADLTRALHTETTAWTAATAPAWARPLIDPDAERLLASIAVWRAAHAVPDTDPRPTGPRRAGTPGRHQTALDRAIRACRPAHAYTQRSWFQRLPDPVTRDPWITVLCHRLHRLDQAGLPLDTYLNEALDAAPPLPDDCPAAALWWRLVPHLGPAALDGDQCTADLLRPDWLPDLERRVPTHRVAGVQDSPAWPALVAAVDAACTRHHWTPDDLLDSAFHALPAGLAADELTEALVWRVAILTDPPDEPEDPGTPESPALQDGPALTCHDEDSSRLRSPDRRQPGSPADDEVALDPVPPSQRAHVRRTPHGPAVQQGDGPPPDTVPRRRIVELHQAALDYYRRCYPKSWAPHYLHERLGTDLSDHPNLIAGYALPGRASLTRHLASEAAATMAELEASGLARRSDGGDLVDAFRDRVVFPIRDTDGSPIAFVGRRNPRKDDADHAGPKYLNTRTTPAYTKGHTLYGLAENTRALDAGALPVLVEGPLDALAVTLASGGAAVGIASLGTALTTHQLDLLHARLGSGNSSIAVATDADIAGWLAAQRAFWQLTAIGADPTHLTLPQGCDPAQTLERHGPDAIQHTLAHARPLGEVIGDQLVLAHRDWSNPATRLTLIREVGRIIAVQPPPSWPAAIDRINQRLHLSPGILHLEVIDQSDALTRDTNAFVAARLADIQAAARRTSHHPHPHPRHRPPGPLTTPSVLLPGIPAPVHGAESRRPPR